ncbi:MAG TPA: DUF3185 family protein [Planctomycetota bacterium]|nr:DUF3185 family protein [Planctomycetota bacterium]
MFSAFMLAVGIALLILGLGASDSLASSFSRMFRGTPTDRATILVLLGTAATVSGLVGFFLTFSRSRPPE